MKAWQLASLGEPRDVLKLVGVGGSFMDIDAVATRTVLAVAVSGLTTGVTV
jgi:hypothetical protein